MEQLLKVRNSLTVLWIPNSPRFPPKIITQNSKLVNCELPADPGQTQEQALENYRNQVKTQSCYSESRKFFTDGDINEVKTFLNSGTAEFMLKIDDSQPFLIDLNHTYSATDVPGMEGELKSQVNAGLPANLQDKVQPKLETVSVGTVNKMLLKLELIDNTLNKLTVTASSF